MPARRKKKLKLDEIGIWSEVKLDIIRAYANEYSKILAAQKRFEHVYIDAFAGAGLHLSKTRQEQIAGSPLIALNTQPPFWEYHFIDLDGSKVDHLRTLIGTRPKVHLYHGDCNKILLADVLPRVKWTDFRRGLCLLDPYGLHLNWEVIQMAGQLKTIDLFLNFPIADMNRNVLRHNQGQVSEADLARMDAFGGDGSWRKVAYQPPQGAFDFMKGEAEKTSNETLAKAFQDRLKKTAGFSYVPNPIPMRNSTGATVYYLFFASANRTAEKIVKHIFEKYRNRGAM